VWCFKHRPLPSPVSKSVTFQKTLLFRLFREVQKLNCL